MRRLGPEPLTGAQKQRRHRERIKARLAEAKIWREGLQGGGLPGLGDFFKEILADLGATPDEGKALCGNLQPLLRDMREAARQRGERDLASLRAKRRKAGGSLLDRLAAIKSEMAED